MKRWSSPITRAKQCQAEGSPSLPPGSGIHPCASSTVHQTACPEHLPKLSLLQAHGWKEEILGHFASKLLFASKRGRILFALYMLIYTNRPTAGRFFSYFYKWNYRDILALLRDKYFLFLNAVYCLYKKLGKIQMPLESPRRSPVRAFYLCCGTQQWEAVFYAEECSCYFWVQ